MERINEEDICYGALVLESFLSMPKRCQEIFFAYLESNSDKKENVYKIFSNSTFDYEWIKSPIESIFYFSYCIRIYENFSLMMPYDLEYQNSIVTLNNKKYIADFLFDTNSFLKNNYIYENELKLIIECDGYEFHKSSKKQIEHDNERDMELKLSGYEVLHFSGSQIYRNPFKCVDSVFGYINSNVGRIKQKVDNL